MPESFPGTDLLAITLDIKAPAVARS